MHEKRNKMQEKFRMHEKRMKIDAGSASSNMGGVQELKKSELGLREKGTGSVQTLGRVLKKPNRFKGVYKGITPFFLISFSSFSL